MGTSRKLMVAGTLLGAIALVRIRGTLGRAFLAHPEQTSRLFSQLGYSAPPSESEVLIAGYQYAFLRRSFPEFKGTSVEQERTALLLWFAVFFVGLAIGLVGIAIATSGI